MFSDDSVFFPHVSLCYDGASEGASRLDSLARASIAAQLNDRVQGHQMTADRLELWHTSSTNYTEWRRIA